MSVCRMRSLTVAQVLKHALKLSGTTTTFQLISCCCSAHVKTGLRLLSLSIDLCGKVHYVIEGNKFDALEQLHFETRDDY